MHWDLMAATYPRMERIFGHDIAMTGLMVAARTWDKDLTTDFGDYAFNKCKFAELDEIRRRKMRPMENWEEHIFPSGDRFFQHIDIEEALVTLDERSKKMIRLYYYEGKELKEVGKVVGLSESGVSLALKTIRQKIRKNLGGYDEET